MTPFVSYLAAIRENLAHDDASEHPHHPALKTLFESSGTRVIYCGDNLEQLEKPHDS